ncbi:aminotransferase class I/II-fold pyridoxal phosphate-dependent enzyme [Streptomyces sp. NPDC101166]|uniref:aminotransferase class I/II-fold pyridoxal phosphate-dependent enzyme n=1 Tax=Streptomyces sp. NPDC101166 TaxID=3366120 RepID=UPI00380814C6
MGEPDFATPEPIADALRQAIRDGHTHYGDLNGDPELRALIAAQASRLSPEPYSERDVLIGHGGSAAITAMMLAVVDPGDRVVIPEPTYSLYPDAVRLAGGEPVHVPMTASHHLDFGALPGARMVVLSNPSNPTPRCCRPRTWHGSVNSSTAPTRSSSSTRRTPTSSKTACTRHRLPARPSHPLQHPLQDLRP